MALETSPAPELPALLLPLLPQAARPSSIRDARSREISFFMYSSSLLILLILKRWKNKFA